MTKEEIGKTLNEYYRKKWGIANGLIFCLAIVVICAITNSILSIFPQLNISFIYSVDLSGITAVIGVLAYILLFVFVIRAALFPMGKYSLYDSMTKGDIVNVLDYIGSMECGFNEQYDHLFVLSRTAEKMVTNIHNWQMFSTSQEGRLNRAWNLLDRYFREKKVLNIDIGNLKSFSEELLSQLSKVEIKEEVLSEIMNRPSVSLDETEKKASKQKRPFRVEAFIYVLCTVALGFIVLYKSAVFWKPDLAVKNRLLEYFQAIGSDIIAIVFAAFSIKACWLNDH